MTELTQLLGNHWTEIIAIAAILAAILPRTSDPSSAWGRARQVLDVLGVNVGNARNAGVYVNTSPALSGQLRQLADLLEAAGLVKDDQARPTPPTQSAERQGDKGAAGPG